uniref:C-type lectin domain-containing protein n=1 Tax=Knipowitschia caucasica TaxID=637954 RepID=A0AAV2LEX7_KNICA
MHQMLLLSLLLSQWSRSESLDPDYTVIVEPKPWSDAQAHCRRFYSDLASVRDMKDQRRLERVLDGITDVWIGLHRTSDQLKDRKWHWSEPTVTYKEADAQWGILEPDDYRGPQNCVVINLWNNWNDKSCSEKYDCFVCYNESSSSVQIHDDKGRSWLEAQQYCRRHHTDLMSGLDQQEQVEKVKPFGKSSCWIGLFRDTWAWSDESPSSFRNWNSDSAINPETEKCAAVGGDGGWKSSDCSRKKSFVCAGGNLVLVKQNKTWEEALIYCRQNHRDLVWNIDTEPWKTQVQDQVRRSDSKLVWVGLHYACFFEAWFWVNGHYVPDDHKDWRKPGEGDCGDVAAVKKNGQWVNRKFEEEHNFICVRSCGCCHGN